VKPEVLKVTDPVPPSQLYVTPGASGKVFGRKDSWVHQLITRRAESKAERSGPPQPSARPGA